MRKKFYEWATNLEYKRNKTPFEYRICREAQSIIAKDENLAWVFRFSNVRGQLTIDRETDRFKVFHKDLYEFLFYHVVKALVESEFNNYKEPTLKMLRFGSYFESDSEYLAGHWAYCTEVEKKVTRKSPCQSNLIKHIKETSDTVRDLGDDHYGLDYFYRQVAYLQNFKYHSFWNYYDSKSNYPQKESSTTSIVEITDYKILRPVSKKHLARYIEDDHLVFPSLALIGGPNTCYFFVDESKKAFPVEITIKQRRISSSMYNKYNNFLEVKCDKIRKEIKRKILRKRSFSPTQRSQILDRANYKCELCLRDSDKLSKLNLHLEIDHRIPFSKGGKTEISNGRSLCSECNKGVFHAFQKHKSYSKHETFN